MSVTERVMAAGDRSITLSSETPRKLLEAINVEAIGFSTLVILPAHLDVRAHTDADLLALARYTGIYRRQEGLTLSGAGLPTLMGDEPGEVTVPAASDIGLRAGTHWVRYPFAVVRGDSKTSPLPSSSPIRVGRPAPDSVKPSCRR